jgi:serine/threonine protein phosphatase 1
MNRPMGNGTVDAHRRGVRTHDCNPAGRDWVVGDLHGCFATLDRALETVGFDFSSDRLFSVGDLVDRGPECRRAPQYLDQPWFHAVLGNHEQFLLESGMGDPAQHALWRANGGDWFFRLPAAEQQSLRRAFAGLPYARQIRTPAGLVGIVHADVPAELSWPEFVEALSRGAENVRETALWGRSRAMGYLRSGVEGVFRVFCGHTPQWRGILRVGNVYCIDTGAVYGLTEGIADAGLTLMRLTADGPGHWTPVEPGESP